MGGGSIGGNGGGSTFGGPRTPQRPRSTPSSRASSPSILSALGSSSLHGSRSPSPHYARTPTRSKMTSNNIRQVMSLSELSGSKSRRQRSFAERMAARNAVTCVKKRIVFDNSVATSASLPLPRPPSQSHSSAPSTPSRHSSTAAIDNRGNIRTPTRKKDGGIGSTAATGTYTATTAPSTPSRSIFSTPLSSSRCNRLTGAFSTSARPSPSRTASDRFIPNRAHMRIDLCRASILSAEKRRMAAMCKLANEIKSGESGNGSDSVQSSPVQTSRENLTPLQSEFRRRMRGALLNVPLEDLGRRQVSRNNASSMSASSGAANRTGENDPSVWSSSAADARNNLSNLAYAALPEDDDAEERDGQGGSAGSGSAGVGLNRMLSFKSSTVLDESFTSTQSAADLTASTLSQSTSSSFTQRSTPRRARRSRSAPIVATGDPFAHDQLHVLHRTASGSSGRFLSGDASLDPMSMADVGLRSVAQKVGRRISPNPSRILDAPELVDDYYLNLISWGKNNVLAVALGQCLYLWNASTGSIKHLLTLDGPEDYVTSVCWAAYEGHTQYIAVGTNDSAVQLWDADSGQKVRTLGGHTSRVGSLAWNQHWLTTGGRDSLILQHDVRSPNHIVSTYTGHTQEVCGLRWNDDGTTLASGGNENYLCLWDAAMSQRGSNRNRRGDLPDSSTNVNPRVLLTQHQAAVKALAWCPFHRGLLASGGGTADRTIKFWNTNSGAMLNSVDTGSQVCSLLWSKHQREICSSHGFSENQLILWRYPTMTKIQEFKGHTARVLHMEQSPDGACVASAAADETLRFWDVFGSPPSRSKADSFSIGGFAGVGGVTCIR